MLALGSALTIGPDYLRTAGSAVFWPRDQIDDYAYASLVAKRAPAKLAGRESVILVGTAAMREGLLPPRDIEDKLTQRLGHDVPVVNLMTGGQSPLEAAALVREVAPASHGTLVLAVSPSRMAASGKELQGLLDHPRLAFWNDGIRDEAKALGLKVPEQTGFYLWDNIQFYSIRLASFAAHWATGRRPSNDVETYLGRGHQNSDEWSKDMGTLSSRLSTYQQNFHNNIEPYRRLIRWVKDNGYKYQVVLLEIPLNPQAIAQATSPDFYPTHAANLENFCREEGCRYVNVNTRHVVPESEFFDWAHLSSNHGKELYTDAVLDQITEGLK